MKNLMAYSGLTTKVRAMKSNLISRSQYEEIVNFTSVQELFAYLQTHCGYKRLFANMDSNSIRRGDIEAFFSHSTFRDFYKIYNFANMQQRKFLDLYFMNYEIDVLKRYLRNIFDSREDSFLTVVENDFEFHSKINTTQVAESSTIDDFINNLKGTIYYAPLHKIYSAGDLTLFDCEMCLDLFFYSTIWKSKNKFFKGKELEIITRSYGIKIDMLNIRGIYRAKKYYNISADEIFRLLIPIRYKMKQDEVFSLINSETPNDFREILERTFYGKFVDPESTRLDYEHIEKSILSKLLIRDYNKNPYSVAAVNTFLFMKEQEVYNLTTIIECIRYKYSPTEILNNLI